MKNDELRLAVIVISISILSVSVVYSALTSNVKISMMGTITTEVTANSGSAADIQAAVNIAASRGGGTVRVPAGTFDWNDETVQVYGMVNVIGAGNTILRQTKAAPFNTMFSVVGNNKPTRISGLQFKGLVTSGNDDVAGDAIDLVNSRDFRIDHCVFTDFPNTAIAVGSGSRGVIDHNSIDNPYQSIYTNAAWGYGIIVSSTNYWSWDDDITHFLGKYETIDSVFPTVYIEDNVINRTRHNIASNQLGWYVIRNNLLQQINYNSNVDVHGAGTNAAGGRGLEAYNNTIIGNSYGFGIRGGSGVIWGNTIKNTQVGVQVAKDIEGTPLHPMNDLWIWGNTYINVAEIFRNLDGYYSENVNYFLRAPTQAQDGFTYMPYQYPHPLTNG